MFDNVTFEASIRPTREILNRNEFIKFGNVSFVGVRDKREPFEITHYECMKNNLRFKLTHDKIIISNSLHKFYHGNNYSDFSLSQINECINKIEALTNINASDFRIKSFEFGVNISLNSNLDEFINCLTTFKKIYPFKPMIGRDNQVYGKVSELTEYKLKFYNKTKEVKIHVGLKLKSPHDKMLRFEFVSKKQRFVPFIKTLEDLRNREKIELLINKINSHFEDIVLLGVMDFSDASTRDRELFFAGQNPEFWKVEMKHNKDKGKEKRNRYKELCSSILQPNQKEELVNLINVKLKQLLEQ